MIETILIAIVSIEAIGIMILEMFGAPKQQANAFELDESFVKMPEVKKEKVELVSYLSEEPKTTLEAETEINEASQETAE